jgi:hypothetical protein
VRIRGRGPGEGNENGKGEGIGEEISVLKVLGKRFVVLMVRFNAS